MALARVLVFTPCNRLEPETLAALFALSYEGPLDRLITRDNPERVRVNDNIIYNYRKMQRVALAERYDAVLIVENDIIPPADTIERLLAVEADIAYGVYGLRRGFPTLNVRHPVSMQSFSEHRAEWVERYGQVIDVSGIGFGCTLIHRPVLEVLELHSDNGGDGDTQLARDAIRAGFRQKADTTLLCGHKRPDGVVLWVQPDGRIRQEGESHPKMVTVRPLMRFSGWNEADELYITQPGDDPVRVTDQMAEDLISAGMAEIVT
jgi:hypothetical protein